MVPAVYPTTCCAGPRKGMTGALPCQNYILVCLGVAAGNAAAALRGGGAADAAVAVPRRAAPVAARPLHACARAAPRLPPGCEAAGAASLRRLSSFLGPSAAAGAPELRAVPNGCCADGPRLAGYKILHHAVNRSLACATLSFAVRARCHVCCLLGWYGGCPIKPSRGTYL